MSDETKGFVSDIFNGEGHTSNIGDVRQTLEYNFVKSYPSVNSSNDGQIHSEENVRWLSKQFVRKPFIVQYDDNNMEEFKYQGAVLNAGTSTGGMVNIDGYLINTAEDLNKMSFDNTQDTMLGTGGPYGYIYHQVLQRAMNAFMRGGTATSSASGFTNSDINDYIQWTTDPSNPWNWDEEKKTLLLNFINKSEPIFKPVGAVTIRYSGDLLDYIEHNVDISNIPTTPTQPATDSYIWYKQEHLSELDPYIDISYIVNYGYTNEKIKFIQNGNITYTTQEPKIDPDTGEPIIDPDTREPVMEDVERTYPDYAPILFVKDIFGLTYIFQSNLSISTNLFPGQLNTNINFLHDDITPTDPQAGNDKIIRSISKMYDMTKCYDSYTSKKSGIVEYNGNNMITNIIAIPDTTSYGERAVGIKDDPPVAGVINKDYNKFIHERLDNDSKFLYIYDLTTSQPSDWGTGVYYTKTETAEIITFTEAPTTDTWQADTYYSKTANPNFVDFQVKQTISSASELTDNNIIINDIETTFFNNDYFNVVSCYDLFDVYKNITGNTVTQGVIQGNAFLKSLCDNYYCLPVSRIDVINFQQLFCLQYPNGDYIPVGFMSSSGNLLADNVINSQDNTIYVEGYASLLRRICKIVAGYDQDDTYKGQDISDTNSNTLGWHYLIKDLQTGNLVPSTKPSSLTTQDQNNIANIFNVSSFNDITFGDIYNKVLAPYINFYVQLSWSALLDKTLLEGGGDNKGRFKARKAYSVLKGFMTDFSSVKRDDGTSMILSLPRSYTYNGNTFTVNQDVEYINNSFTDYERLENFLCSPALQYKSGTGDVHNITYRDTESVGNISIINKFEDYISYIKKCSNRGWDDNLERRLNSIGIVIPYKITTLERDITTYGFTMLDRMVDEYRKYTNKYVSNNDVPDYDYNNITTENDTHDIIQHIQKGYIQNVGIRLDNFTPNRNSFIGGYQYPNSNIPTDEIYRSLVGSNYYVYTVDPLEPKTYSLWLNSYSTVEYSGQRVGLTGFCAIGHSQGWSVCIPTVFRLYKDSQNYLNGRYRGTTHHGGVYIDYKLPNDIDDSDFWFANTWISNVRFVGIWEIESSAVSYPTETDGMAEYLHRRNHTLFNVNTIYDIDNLGNYVNLKEYIQQFINSSESSTDTKIQELRTELLHILETAESGLDTRITNLNNYINNTPTNGFIDFPLSETTSIGREPTYTQYKGMENNINRLKNYVDDIAPECKTDVPAAETLYISNNTFYDINNYSQSTITIKSAIVNTLGPTVNQRFVINTLQATTDYPNSNNVLKTTIKLTMSNSSDVTVKLGTELNKFASTLPANKVDVTWTSNYPIDHVSSEGVYTINIRDYYTTQLSCLIELTITPTTSTTADGYCNVVVLCSTQNTLTIMDMNYLWKELYNLESMTWEQVSNMTALGMAPKLWKLGDTKTFKITYDNVEYNIPAMIIGFNSENAEAYDSSAYPYTITWLTNIYNNDIDNIDTVALFNHKFDHAIPSAGNQSQLYGYNNYENDTFTLSVMDWMNNKDTGIIHYTDPGFKAVTTPVCKTTGMAYTCSLDGAYGIVKNIDTRTIDNEVISGGTTSSNKHESTFWLPSLSELGLYFESDDPAEHYFYSNHILPGTRNSESTIVQDSNSTYVVNEVSPAKVPDVTYPYFKLNRSVQNVKSLTLLSSSYYDINKELTHDTTVDNFVTAHRGESVTDNNFRTQYDTIKRYQYVVGTSYDIDNLHGRFLTVLPKEDVASILNGKVNTDFCFVTK